MAFVDGIIGVSPNYSWVAGTFGNNGGQGNPVGAETNVWLLGVLGVNDPSGMVKQPLVGSIGMYAKDAGVYKCPADYSVYKKAGQSLPRVRSVSANCYVGSDATQIGDNYYYIFTKFSNFPAKLGPSDAIVFADENPTSINDGWLDISEPLGVERPSRSQSRQRQRIDFFGWTCPAP